MANNKKNVTISVDKAIYNGYTKFCKKKGLIISRQFEILMEEQIERDKNGKFKRRI